MKLESTAIADFCHLFAVTEYSTPLTESHSSGRHSMKSLAIHCNQETVVFKSILSPVPGCSHCRASHTTH